MKPNKQPILPPATREVKRTDPQRERATPRRRSKRGPTDDYPTRKAPASSSKLRSTKKRDVSRTSAITGWYAKLTRHSRTSVKGAKDTKASTPAFLILKNVYQAPPPPGPWELALRLESGV
ncbi:hypothetical protein BDV98DRAFT_594196 [Pterulicium gracile]|uniref:Uncharacterized protein n=1 Tax=Pterulicium gracile TaxID=1884261 RepID=A0A5C3QEC2_9AGAR|nr:hypothetical protein BDV98DRAFT_594196 [Pterula gracilis]